MDQRLKEYEARRIASRSFAPDLTREIASAHARLGLEPSKTFAVACRELIQKLAEEAENSEAEYHNLYHVQDVVDATALLLTCNEDLIEAELNEVLLIAALGHDLHHDGRGALREGDFERRSAKTVAGVCVSSGFTESTSMLIEALIVSTSPPTQMSLRSEMGRATLNDPAHRMMLILGEADVLASLTPRLGRDLSLRLEEEWLAAGVEAAHAPSSVAGRRQFLTAYRRLSAEALDLGVDVMIAEQLNSSGDPPP